MRAIALALAIFAAAAPAAAETYPNHPIELVVPFVAGGTTDTVARLIAQRLTDHLGPARHRQQPSRRRRLDRRRPRSPRPRRTATRCW